MKLTPSMIITELGGAALLGAGYLGASGMASDWGYPQLAEPTVFFSLFGGGTLLWLITGAQVVMQARRDRGGSSGKR